MNVKKFLPVACMAACIIVFQAFTALSGQDYFLTQLTMAAYYSLAIIGLCLLMGYAGQISIGHAGFFAIGGYTTAVLSKMNISPWLSLAAAIGITIVVAFLIGIPILKLKGHYLAMATLGFGVIIYRIVLGTRLFGEADGLHEVPPFAIPGGLQVSGDMGARVQNYYIAWFLVVLAVIMVLNLIDSRVGRALRSIHGSEEAANAMGVDTARYKLMVFVISAVFAAIGGFFLTHFNAGIGPSESEVMKSIRYVAIVAVGGMANLWGGLVMGVILNYLSLRGYFGSYDDAFFGLVLIVIMLFAPEGVVRPLLYRRLLANVVELKNRFLKRNPL